MMPLEKDLLSKSKLPKLGIEQIVLVRPRGFCAGVERAINIVEQALEKYGTPIYIKHAIVHNTHVVERLEAQGAIFVEALEDVPNDAMVIFSAHGVGPQSHQVAKQQGLDVIDATCPLVTKVHNEALRYSKEDKTIFLVGHNNHVEVEGTRGYAPTHITVVGSEEEAQQVEAKDPEKVAFLTQTTLSIDEAQSITNVLKARFPAITSPHQGDICYATQNRQNAVRKLALEVDLILVLGSKHSSNSNRLAEVAQSCGVEAYLINTSAEIDWRWLEKTRRVGITAGASAPEDLVESLVATIQQHSQASVREMEVIAEKVHFSLPKRLMQ